MLLHHIRRSVSFIPAIIVAAGLSLNAVAGVHAEDLTPWKGYWVSAVSLLNTPAVDSDLQSAYEEQGKKDGITAQEWKTNKLSKWNTAIKSMTVDNDVITFTLGDGSQVTGKYTYAGAVTTTYGEHELQWSKFTSEDEGVWHSVMLMQPEISEDHTALTHFHLRYGNDGFEPLQDANVFPTMVAPDTTAAQFATDFAE
ncbi:metal-binding protein ZinT [Salmonella enterica subsp. enterica serovar Newport]|nr:metal-binding protein ZinT [Salmonella enterica subsp. enterica serovar Newport]EJA5030599.1 ZinT/AdcA family metal-binding protein [Salmonella enterica]HBM0103051.1 ZinT/AdcA family metal-binding protein [Salmonella enterica subsp. enterica serovar Wedding]EJA5054572.1 ZinT/AdcA family metal-binding protein [Salmonella enterica]EJA5151453.1 ZinT/AdcA family metal-binding protein [Salmonella enterica]